jgi:hypothetical protein
LESPFILFSGGSGDSDHRHWLLSSLFLQREWKWVHADRLLSGLPTHDTKINGTFTINDRKCLHCL